MVSGYYSLLEDNMSCEIFTKPLIQDIPNINDGSFSLAWLRERIPTYSSNMSGIWQPIWITPTSSNTQNISPLYPVRSNRSPDFAPCNCSDSQINPDPLYEDSSLLGLCSYCNPTGQLGSWRLYDSQGNQSPRTYPISCCNGGCDTMLKADDYIPKIPYLNHAYITGLVDSKHHRQFPMCNNNALGYENFIRFNNLSTINGAELRVDWRIQETISEIPYDKITSQHDSQHMHEIAYQKSKHISSTCGNFIMLSLPENSDTGNFYRLQYPMLQNLMFSQISGDIPDTNLPTPEQFRQIPYGFDRETYKNIFIKQNKLGSYWKWNYTSGILCWYRYYNIRTPNDNRPIRDVDLYISPGDIFFAKNDGPEPQGNMNDPFNTVVGSISSCPSGLKIVQGSDVSCIIPSGSEFAYISANIYDQFYNLYYKILNNLNIAQETEETEETEVIPNLAKQAFYIAAILATSPQYDQITVDLLNNNINSYTYNIYTQINSLNRQMSIATNYDSISRLNYISNRTELFDTLIKKYGAYLWVPPQSNTTITFNNSVNSTFSLNLNFDLVFSRQNTNWAPNSRCTPISSCSSRSFRQDFSYTQSIGYGLSTISTDINSSNIRYVTTCAENNGVLTNSNYGLYAKLYLNQSVIKSTYYSNGCYTLSGIYPRISRSTDSVFCSDCDKYSSFYLIPNAEIVECANLAGNNSFCYRTLAFRLNNSPPPNRNRTERLLADGTKRLTRSYDARFFNPYIDSIAFHPDNGVFIYSAPYKIYGSSFFEKLSTPSFNVNQNIFVSFNTQNIGLKIYDLEAEYLQSQRSRTNACKRFPVTETCKCLPIISTEESSRPKDCTNPNPTSFTSNNVFTPNLSTRYAPTIKSRGGFSQQELDNIFGVNRVIAGGTIPILSSYVNPTQSACSSSASITLYNYTNTEWNIRTNRSNNSSIYITATENINITGPRTSLSAKRFATKITINNNDTIYANQTSPPFDVQDFNIKLQNPFLERAITSRGGLENTILYPPFGNLSNINVFGDNRGNETSAITLTFKQFFPSTKLVFVLPRLDPMGTLQEGFFHPNSGLTASPTTSTPIKNNTIFYENELFTEDQFLSGKVYTGDLTNPVINSIKNLHSFDMNKKLRIYIKSQNKWYYYAGSNIGAFKTNNIKYPGKPFIFEYNVPKNSKNLPSVLVTPVKKHVEFQFINNQVEPLLTRNTVKFPYISNTCSIDSIFTQITLPGMRHYFMIPEIDPSILIPINSITQISTFDFSTLNEPITLGDILKLQDNSYWICINANNLNNRKSYILTEFTYYNHSFTNNTLDFTNISLNGYVYNSRKKCNYSIFLYNNDNLETTNTIINKSIYIKYTTVDNQPITSTNTTDRYMQTYTVLDLALPVRRDTTKVKIFSSPSSSQTNLVVGKLSVPISETSSYLLNKYLPGKWGDVIDYDGSLVDPIIAAKFDIKEKFPQPTYNNFFHQIIINNYSTSYLYQILNLENNEISNNTIQSGIVYYCILHPYTIGDTDTSYSLQNNKYHNFIPLMDLNILEDGFTAPSSGTIKIGGVTKNINPAEGYTTYDNNRFWINFLPNDFLQNTFVPTNNEFYSDTLRIDYPIYAINNISTSNILEDNNYNYRAYFYPNQFRFGRLFNTQELSRNSSFNLELKQRDIPYFKYPIYADRDDDTCENRGCFGNMSNGIDKVGDTEIKATYLIATNTSGPAPYNISDFSISYDAGIYNPIGSNSLIQIQRVELNPDNPIDQISDYCKSNYVLPTNYKINSSSPIYQDAIRNGTLNTLTIDRHANEMLFRILYGESQYINKQMYFINNTIYNKQDIILYSDPRVTAEDIYNQILYNYDRQSSMPLKINGNINIYGVMSIGSTTTITIDNTTIRLQIVRSNNNIYVRCLLPDGTTEDILIFNEIIESTNYLVQTILPGEGEPSPPQPGADNIQISFVGSCLTSTSYSFRLVADSYYGPGGYSLPPSETFVSSSTVCPVSWEGGYGWGEVGGGGSACCSPGGGVCCQYSFTNVIIQNVRQCICGVPQVGKINFVGGSRTFPMPCVGIAQPLPSNINSEECTPFDLGYCRKRDCVSCGETLTDKTEINFEYDWKYCRTNFNLFGHIYREIHSFDYTSRPIPRPQELVCGVVGGCQPIGGPYTEICENIPYPIYIGSRQTEMDAITQNGYKGPQSNPCDISETYVLLVGDNETYYRNRGYVTYDGPCCVPLLGVIPSCSEVDNRCDGRICGCGRCDPLGNSPNCNNTDIGMGGCRPVTYCYKESLFQNCQQPPGVQHAGAPFPQQNRGDSRGGTIEDCETECHVCGVSRTGSRAITTNKVFLRRQLTTNTYNPRCANLLCSVQYKEGTITLNINNKSICMPTFINRCPNININSTMDQLSINDTIDSMCDRCASSDLKITLDTQTIPFVTKREIRKCLVNTMSTCNANPKGLVGGAVHKAGGWSQTVAGLFVTWNLQCGGGSPEYVCGQIGQLIYYSDDPTYDLTYECLEGISCEVPDAIAPYEVEERLWRYSLRGNIHYSSNPTNISYGERNRYLGLGSSHIPVENMLEGVVPDSVSPIQVMSYNAGGQKLTRLGDIVDGISTVYVFYFTYEYIRPVNIQDILRNDDNIICSKNNVLIERTGEGSTQTEEEIAENIHKTGGICEKKNFPSAYVHNFTSIGANNFIGSRGDIFGITYTQLNPTFAKESCDTSVSCYYTDKVFICGSASVCCRWTHSLSKDEGMIPQSEVIQGKTPCGLDTYNF